MIQRFFLIRFLAQIGLLFLVGASLGLATDIEGPVPAPARVLRATVQFCPDTQRVYEALGYRAQNNCFQRVWLQFADGRGVRRFELTPESCPSNGLVPSPRFIFTRVQTSEWNGSEYGLDGRSMFVHGFENDRECVRDLCINSLARCTVRMDSSGRISEIRSR